MGVSIWNIQTLSYIEFQNVKARPIEHKSHQLIKDENCLKRRNSKHFHANSFPGKNRHWNREQKSSAASQY